MQLSINQQFTFNISKDGDAMLINGKEFTANLYWVKPIESHVLVGHKSYNALVDKIDKENKEITIRINGNPYNIQIKEDIDIMLEQMGLNMAAQQKAAPLKAPMPGLVLKVLVQEGQQVAKGDALIILEAMKMENVLKATTQATIKSIKVSEKSAIEKGAILIEME